jgi:phage gpG-like protein
MQQFSVDLKQIKEDLEKLMNNDIPRIVGREAVNFYKASFDNQGFTKKRKGKWKGRIYDTKEQKGKPILHGSGELEESIDYRIESGKVIIFSDKEYAEIMNEGGKIPVTDKMRKFMWAMYYETDDEFYKKFALTKKKTITIPKRQFMGFSDKLNSIIEKQIDNRVDEIFK